MSDTDRLKVQIQEKLIESGEYDRISALLREKLLQAGWYDNIKKLANDQVTHDQEPNFTRLSGVLEPKALSMVPENVRAEVLLQIKAFLESIIVDDDNDE